MTPPSDSSPRLAAAADAPPDTPAVVRWAVWFIERIGFPIAVAAYVLFSLGGKMDKIGEKLERLITITEARK